MRWTGGPLPSRSWMICDACSTSTRVRSDEYNLAAGTAGVGLDAVALRLAGRGAGSVAGNVVDDDSQCQRALRARSRHAAADARGSRDHFLLAESCAGLGSDLGAACDCR